MSQTITFGKLADKKETDAPFTLTATASSKLSVSYRVNSGPAKISGNTITLTGSGTVIIEANQSGNSAYNPAPTVIQNVLVEAIANEMPKKTDQIITFPDMVAATGNEGSVTLMATASSGLNVSYRLKSGPATISGNKVTMNNLGAVVIEAYQAGNDKFNAAQSVTRSFTVGANSSTSIVKLDQTISFSVIKTHYEKEQFTLDAQASSGLPITYRIISGPASIIGNKITLTDLGTVVVEASQGGNYQYNNAASKNQTFKVTSSQKAGVNSDNFFDESNQKLNDEVAENLTFDVKIYPNPASANTTVQFILQENSDVSLELFNLQGMLIKRISLGLNESKVTNTYKLGTEDLPAGVYIVRILTKNNSLNKRLLIVK